MNWCNKCGLVWEHNQPASEFPRCPVCDLKQTLSLALAQLGAAQTERNRLQNERPSLTAALDECRWIARRVNEWADTFGDALIHGTRPDTYGEGMRQAKAQVKAIVMKGTGGAQP